MERRFARGFFLGATYTWSQYREAMERLNPRDAGPHHIVANGRYELPFGRGKAFLGSSAGVLGAVAGGWSVQAIYTWQSGPPIGFGNITFRGSLADPDQAPVPVQRFLSKDYAAGRVETPRAFPESVDCLPAPAAADSEGNLVALTISRGGWFGSCLTVPGTGILLGHGMCRLDPRPGRDAACGMRGGRRIASVVAQICQRVVDYGWSGRQAVIAPRLHVETQEPVEATDSRGRAQAPVHLLGQRGRAPRRRPAPRERRQGGGGRELRGRSPQALS